MKWNNSVTVDRVASRRCTVQVPAENKEFSDNSMLRGDCNLFSRPSVYLRYTRTSLCVGTRQTSAVILCYFVAKLLSWQFVVFAWNFKLSQLYGRFEKWDVICYCTSLKLSFFLAFLKPSRSNNLFLIFTSSKTVVFAWGLWYMFFFSCCRYFVLIFSHFHCTVSLKHNFSFCLWLRI
jgi:hypothetical protein